MKQHTINSEFSFTGKGLHTGLNITARFLPAEDNTGVRLCRVDLPDRPCYEALADYVTATERGTVLQQGEWKVSTVEHALSALYAMGVDNCLIEVDAPEMPILDGSAKYYVEAIEKVGLKEQTAEQKVFVVRRRMEFDNKNGSKIVLLPDDEYSLDVHIGFQSMILNNQFASLESLGDYGLEIASARTFVFLREIQPLLQMGLIKGGDLKNAIVIYDEPLAQDVFDEIADRMGQPRQDASKLGYLCTLNYDNEPARHKLLDLIGDLSLLGYRIQGRVIATRPGHGINTAFCRQLRQELKRIDILPPVYKKDHKPIYETTDIIKILPHRYPMLLVDKILSMDEKSVVGIKNFTSNEPFFQGHFPKEPVVPGVLLIEAMAQTGGVLVLHEKENPNDYMAYLVKVDKAKFRQKVKPGDTILLKLTITEPIRRGFITMQGYCFVNERIVCEAELTAQITNIKNINR